MFYFCIFYIIPCLITGYFVNKFYSEGDIDYYISTGIMLFAIIPLLNIFAMIACIKHWYDRRT